MPAYSFKERFIPKIESGDKTHTIRGKRKARPLPGQKFVGFYAMRTKHCRKIIESVITQVQDIMIEVNNRRHMYYLDFRINGNLLAHDEMETLAVRDGFSCLREMMEFWEGRLPFSGDIIHWKFPGSMNMDNEVKA